MDCHLNLSHKLVFRTLEVSTKIELSHHEGELTFRWPWDPRESQWSPGAATLGESQLDWYFKIQWKGRKKVKNRKKWWWAHVIFLQDNVTHFHKVEMCHHVDNTLLTSFWLKMASVKIRCSILPNFLLKQKKQDLVTLRTRIES